ncbi:MAG: histone deacetylase [Vicinamibacterales bacterium]
MSLILIGSERFLDHVTPPGHPESPERGEAMAAIAAEWRRGGGEIVAPREATLAQLERVHTPEHVRRIAATAGLAVALDPDTFTSPDTYEVARLAAGAAIEAVERVMGGSHVRALALCRPPGHHAERDRAMGFCFFNSVAAAAAHARTVGAARVAIVDIDVHHGNGTQQIFESDPGVLYLSLHQYPYYPGTGAADEVGFGAGAGYSVNLPLEAGAGDADYRLAFTEVVDPVLRQFAPDAILVSAGFDAHERDPLGGMRVTTAGFSAMVGALRHLADELCGGRLAAVTEGGYDLRALTDCLRDTAAVLGAAGSPPPWPDQGEAPRGRAAVVRAQAALARYWRF